MDFTSSRRQAVRLCWAFLGLSLALPVAAAEPSRSIAPNFDSETSIMLDAKAAEGKIIVRRDSTDIESEIHEQLNYTLAQLNAWGASPQLGWFKSRILRRDENEVAGLVTLTYEMQGKVAWPRTLEIPNRMEIVLPARGDREGLEQFAGHYLSQCSEDPKANLENWFYYFLPNNSRCPLSLPNPASERGKVFRFNVQLGVSASNTQNKSPEYNRIWEDGKLSVTVIFGKDQAGSSSNWDWGIRAYNDMFKTLRKMFGSPIESNIPNSVGTPGARYPHITLLFQTSSGLVDVDMSLVDALPLVDDSFRSRFGVRAADSDLVIYNGHASYGDNVNSLSRLARFKQGQYQIYFVNGCDTFSYVNSSFFEASMAANPGSGKGRYLDVISNGMSGWFHALTPGTMELIKAAYRRTGTYRQILSKIDKDQKAIVDGEEDNP